MTDRMNCAPVRHSGGRRDPRMSPHGDDFNRRGCCHRCCPKSQVLSVYDNTPIRRVSGGKVSVPVRNVLFMSKAAETMPVVDFTAGMAGLLDTVDTSVGLLTDRQQLDVAAELLCIQSRLTGVVHAVLGAVDRNEAAQAAHGVPMTSWLAAELCYTRAQASAMLHHAADLERFQQVGEALRGGHANAFQARAVTDVLRKLPDDLSTEAVEQAQATMVGFCAEFDSQLLKGLAQHLLEVVAPEIAEEAEAARLERERKAALRNRHLDFVEDGHGSTIIRGKLPTADAALVKAQIDALAHQMHRTALEACDPLQGEISWPMRRADALVELARRVAVQQAAPTHGGDRPHVTITIGYEDLLKDCWNAELGNGHKLTAGELRQFACDADILPVVLGGPSGVLDVGRKHRLVTPQIRQALHARDHGCIFPGCNRPAADCDAHHIVPWQQGGATSLTNLCLLCKHHHNLLEPDKRRAPDLQWQIRIGPDGVPEVIPPRYVDKFRRPRRHQRFRHPGG